MKCVYTSVVLHSMTITTDQDCYSIFLLKFIFLYTLSKDWMGIFCILKSTSPSQVALIVFLSHIGSFVPADAATVGVTDRLRPLFSNLLN